MLNIAHQSKAVADDISPQMVGIDPFTILSLVQTLLPLLANCFKQQASAQSPKEYLSDHFDEITGSFDQSLINRVRPQTRRAARENGQRRLSRDQLDRISEAALARAKDADDDVVSACMEEAA